LRKFKATFLIRVCELELKYDANYTKAFAFKQLVRYVHFEALDVYEQHSSRILGAIYIPNPSYATTIAIAFQTIATLALGSRPRQSVTRLQAKWETWEHSTCSRECKECEGMNPHIPKWTPMLGVGVPKGLPNLQSAIAGVKSPRLEEFFISLESCSSVDV
jgi:hypothetical protein